MVGTIFNIDTSRITDSANVSCSMDNNGIKVDCNYAYDDFMGTMDTQNLFNTRRQDDETWGNAMRIAGMIQRRFGLPLVITYGN